MESLMKVLIVIILILLIGEIAFSIFLSFSPRMAEENKLYEVVDKYPRQDHDGHYLVHLRDMESGEIEVAEIRDSLALASFDASDRYANLVVGEVYNFHLAGFRIHFLSEYRYIISYERVD